MDRELSDDYLRYKNLLITTSISLLYLLLSYILIGFKKEQLVLVLLFNALFYISPGTRKFIIGFSVFIVFWILFDYMKAFPNYTFNTVHIESIYQAEKNLFGLVQNDHTVLTPNEFWLQHQHTFLDIMAGLFYLCWMPVPLLFGVYLFYKNKEAFAWFSLTFLLVNLVGFVVYYTYPAAPPWYVQQYGFTFHANTPGNTAGLARFDAFFHTGIFAGLYTKSSNVFAAMPSLHSAYPMVVLFYGLKYKVGVLKNILFGMVTVGIWFAAVYSSHHYVLDVLAGMGCAVTGIFLFSWLAQYNKVVKRFIAAFVERITVG